jgi:very-short-patch-repair endonuclease
VVNSPSATADLRPRGWLIPLLWRGGAKRRGGLNKQHLTMDKILTYINGFPIKYNFIENLPYNINLIQKAKELRKAGILSEVLFWQEVHKKKFYNIDFDRQRIIGNYIVDFYVKGLGLIIEIDGISHDDKYEYDIKRQAYLESLNLKVYRIDDLDIKTSSGEVLIGLENYIIENFKL